MWGVGGWKGAQFPDAGEKMIEAKSVFVKKNLILLICFQFLILTTYDLSTSFLTRFINDWISHNLFPSKLHPGNRFNESQLCCSIHFLGSIFDFKKSNPIAFKRQEFCSGQFYCQLCRWRTHWTINFDSPNVGFRSDNETFERELLLGAIFALESPRSS